jgi:hypothetical protein
MKFKLLIFAIIGAMTFTACSTEGSDEVAAEGSPKSEAENDAGSPDEAPAKEADTNGKLENNEKDGPEVNSRYAYDQDWVNIKEAILKKDYKGLKNYCVDEDVDVELLIDQIHYDDELLKQLKAMSYEDLSTQEEPSGDILLVASLAVSGVEEGIEYESGIYIYLEQGDPSLMVVRYLAAG